MLKKILIVEDEPLVLSLCDAVLRRGNFDTILARNGVEGLETYRARHKEICLVLSDVTMPEMSGIGMARTIFKLDPHSKIIMMSGYNLSVIIPEEVAEICSVIQKPFTAAQLIETVKKCLKYQEHGSIVYHPRLQPDVSCEVA